MFAGKVPTTFVFGLLLLALPINSVGFAQDPTGRETLKNKPAAKSAEKKTNQPKSKEPTAASSTNKTTTPAKTRPTPSSAARLTVLAAPNSIVELDGQPRGVVGR